MNAFRSALFLSVPLLLAGGCARERSASHGLKQKGIGVAQYQQDFDEPTFPADDLNRATELKSPAKRVVVIGPGAVETMFALGAQRQLVGRDDFSNFPPAAKKVTIGGNFQGPNIEQCLALRPDLVVVQGETSNKGKFEDWQSKLGVPVAAWGPTNFVSLAKDFRKLGAWVGKNAEANTLAKKFEALPLAPGNAPRALIKLNDRDNWVAGGGTLVSDTVSRGGYANIADDLGIKGYKEINVESLLVKQPDVVIVPSTKPKSQVLAMLRANAALSALKCVRQGRVIVVDSDLLLRPAPRLLLGVQQLRAWRP